MNDFTHQVWGAGKKKQTVKKISYCLCLSPPISCTGFTTRQPFPATLVPTPRTELSRHKFLPQLAENEDATEKEPYGAKIASIAIFKVKMRPSYAL